MTDFNEYAKPLPTDRVKAVKIDAGMTTETPSDYRGWMIRTQAAEIVNTVKALAMSSAYNVDIVDQIQSLSPAAKELIGLNANDDLSEWAEWEKQNPSPYGATVEDSLKRFTGALT